MKIGSRSSRFVGVAALAAFLVAGCDTSPNRGDYTAVSPNERRVQFTCRDGEQVEMRFFDVQGVGVLVRQGRTLELQQQQSGSGFLYSDGSTTVRGKGRDIRIQPGGGEPVECRSQSD